ncbi:MAG: flagellin-like protein [Clostridiales bacterium]|nr:flagellin-like protein [Clostridiales bacterium]
MIGMLSTVYAWAMCKWNEFKTEESGAVDIVAIVVMIGIAVILAVLFRTQIESLLSSLFTTIESNATSAVS